MDIQYLGGALLALLDIQGDGPRPATRAAEDAYYERHASGERLYAKVAPFVVAVGLGLVAIGSWPH